MLYRSALLASAFTAFAYAQTIETSSASSVAPSSTVAEVMPPQATASFNIGNVTSSEKFQWCLAQLNTCPQICGGAASENQCDNEALTYSCVCPNGTVPDSTAYMQTLPYFICQQTYIQCVANNPNNAEGQATCRENEQCGTRNATAEAISATSTPGGTTAAATSSGSATASSASASATADSSDGSITTYTSGAFAAIMLAVLKLLL